MDIPGTVPGELRMQITIKRAATGLEEHYTLVGKVTGYGGDEPEKAQDQQPVETTVKEN